MKKECTKYVDVGNSFGSWGRETQPPGFIYTVTILAESITHLLVLGIVSSTAPCARHCAIHCCIGLVSCTLVVTARCCASLLCWLGLCSSLSRPCCDFLGWSCDLDLGICVVMTLVARCHVSVMSDTPILSLYSWDPSIGCYAADH